MTMLCVWLANPKSSFLTCRNNSRHCGSYFVFFVFLIDRWRAAHARVHRSCPREAPGSSRRKECRHGRWRTGNTHTIYIYIYDICNIQHTFRR